MHGALLAGIVEGITGGGLPYPAALRRLVIEPLGLQSRVYGAAMSTAAQSEAERVRALGARQHHLWVARPPKTLGDGQRDDLAFLSRLDSGREGRLIHQLDAEALWARMCGLLRPAMRGVVGITSYQALCGRLVGPPPVSTS